MQSRYYDPKIGRFINADSLVSTGQGVLGYNMFAYCLNDPTNLDDHSGCAPKEKVAAPFVLIVCIDNENGGSGGGNGGGGIDPGIILIQLILELINTISKYQNKAKKDSSNAVYYGIDMYGGIMNQITGPMDFATAADWAKEIAASNKYSDRASWGLYTQKEADAQAMAIYLGCSPDYTHDGKKGTRLAHFHPAERKIFGVYAHSFHMWYGA